MEKTFRLSAGPHPEGVEDIENFVNEHYNDTTKKIILRFIRRKDSAVCESIITRNNQETKEHFRNRLDSTINKEHVVSANYSTNKMMYSRMINTIRSNDYYLTEIEITNEMD